MADLTGLGSIADLAGTVINKIWPDKTEQEKQQLALVVQMVQGQLDANKVEAASPSVFVSGWRPFVGWVCGSGLAVNFLIAPLAEWACNLLGHPAKFPHLDLSELMPLLLGMLGMGTLRTYEKVTGVANR
jgi:hypothetical protein